MPNALQSPAYYLVVGALCGLVGFRIGWRSRLPWLMVAYQTVLAYFAFWASWRVRGAWFAALAVLGWAIATSIVSIHTFRREPERVDEQVFRARPYREMMLAWLKSGRGPEARPFRTIFEHARELVVYTVAALLTANFAGLALGAILLNYMNAYVARLLTASRHPATVGLLAWNVWSVVRVLAYIAIGAASAGPLFARAGLVVYVGEIRTLAVIGAVGVLLDLTLKLSLSRVCGRRLADAVDLERAGG